METKNPVFISSPEKQDFVGYCGAMANSNLFAQSFCKEDPSQCFVPSFLDYFNKMAEKFPEKVSDGSLYTFIINSETFFEMYNSMGKARSSRCFPISVFFNQELSISQRATWDERSHQHYKDIFYRHTYDPECQCYRLPIRGGVTAKSSELRELDITREEYLKIFFAALSSSVEKSGCQEYPIPKIRPVRVNLENNGKEKLSELTRNGHSILLGLRIKQPDGISEGPHAVVVSNSREVCCSRFCYKQFQIIDSLGLYWSSTREPGNWISADELFNSLESQSGTYLESESGEASVKSAIVNSQDSQNSSL